MSGDFDGEIIILSLYPLDMMGDDEPENFLKETTLREPAIRAIRAIGTRSGLEMEQMFIDGCCNSYHPLLNFLKP